MFYDGRELFDVISREINLPDSSKAKNCIAEGFLRYIYEFTTPDNKKMTVEYTLTVSDDIYSPYGIRAVVKDADNRIVDRGEIHRRYATLSECTMKMLMMVHEVILPCTLDYVM